MRTILTATVLAVSLYCGGAWAYGGGGGGHACAEPKFFEPAPTGAVASLSQFSFIASENTDIDTLTVDIGGRKIPPTVDKGRGGDFEVKAVLPQPITQAGKVRIGVDAKSKEGCWGTLAVFLDIKP